MTGEGLTYKFKVNRPLTEKEINCRLYQNRRLILGENDLCDDISVIKMNSLFMDTVNRFYKDTGWITLGGIVMLSLCLWCLGLVVFSSIPFSRKLNYSLLLLLLSSPFVGFGIYVFFKESFSWTHYPIRFNRERQLLHVFRRDGSVLTVPWNEVFFTLGRSMSTGGRYTDIRGHILDEDGITVRETFHMGTYGTERDVYRYWEFIRRYMSPPEGPGEIIDRLTYCLPIDGKREGYKFGFWRLHAMWNGGSSFFGFPFIPFTFVLSLTRYLAMSTSKVPQWPQEVLAQNSEVADNDPYLRTAKDNKPLVWWWNTVWD